METQSIDRHKPDRFRLVWLGDVIHAHPGREVAAPFAEGLRNRLCVVLRLVGIGAGTKQIGGFNHQQEVVMYLQVKVPGVWWRGEKGDWRRMLGVGDV